MVCISYGNPDLTIAAVNSLCMQSHEIDVVLWDNYTSDYTRSRLGDMTCSSGEVTKVFSDENLFWTPAINKAIERFGDGYEFIGFMNNDIVLQPGTIQSLRALLQQRDVGLVGPMGARLGGPGDFVTHLNAAMAMGMSQEEFMLTPLRGTYMIGACAMLRKDVWDEVGELDNDMPLGADDHDYSLRVKQAGYQIWADPSNPADHVGHATRGSSNWSDLGGKSWEVFNQKWSGYYRSETEAVLCHWGGIHTPGWDIGSGWLTDEEREPIYKIRIELHNQNLEIGRYRNRYLNINDECIGF